MSTHRTSRPAQTSHRSPATQLIAGRLLLACGITSSVLYLFTDLLGGLRYPGYSFVSQAISELSARVAP